VVHEELKKEEKAVMLRVYSCADAKERKREVRRKNAVPIHMWREKSERKPNN
jgi:hypothetical protein